MKADEPYQRIEASGLVAIIRTQGRLDSLLEVGDALLASPVTALAISLGSRDPLAAIAELRARFGRNMLIGAGVAANRQQVELALAAGAQFLLAASFDAEAAQTCARAQAGYLPRATTPEHAHALYALGCTYQTVFPCCGWQRADHASEPAAFCTMAAPARLLVMGGVNETNMAALAQAGAGAAGVRGVLGVDGRWSMPALIRQVRRLRALWLAGKTAAPSATC